MASLRWTKIPTRSLPRSSHSISICNGKAYIFGGEVQPRSPVDNVVHTVDLDTGSHSLVPGQGEMPEARVGHTASIVSGEILLFGGRGGPEMTPLAESGAVHAFSPSTSTWRRLNPTTSDFPCARSYHTSTASPTHLIIHAGCGDAVTGRLNDTWAFEPSSRAWTKLDDAPGDPRGGPGLTWIHDRIWRFGGFNGEVEIGGSIDYLPFSQNDSKDATRPSWSSILYSQSSDDSTPGARSVAGLHPLGNTYDLVTFFGEGRPSPTGGHDSAGNFWGDVWVFSPLTEKWSEVVIESDGESGDGPGERGWFASDVDEKGRVVLWGGIDGRNERLGDGWVLSSA